MPLDFYSTLDQLTNPTHDMGGGGMDARAIAQLILGGGQASVADPTTGAQVPLWGGGAPPSGVSPTFAQVLKDAEAMASAARGDQLRQGATAGPGQGNSLTANPYGPGQFDPRNQSSVAAVRAQGADPVSEAFYSVTPQATPGPDPRAMTQADIQAAIDGRNPSGTRQDFSRSKQTLVANPYGPGSYDPTDPTAVAAVNAAGGNSKKVEQAQQLIKQLTGDKPSTDIGVIMQELLSAAPNAAAAEQIRNNGVGLASQLATQREQAWTQRQQAVSPIVKNILESVGVGPNKYQEAYAAAAGRAAGEKAGGGKRGDAQGINDVLSAAGTPDFAEKVARAEAEGRITNTQATAAYRMHDQRMKQKTPEEKLVTGYENAQASLKRFDRLGAKYDKAVAGGSDLSKNLKLSLSRNANLAMFLSPDGPRLPMIKNLTDDEASFVTEMNSMLIGMRQLYDDGRMSDQDVKNFLQALGDPKSGPQMFRSQLAATRQVIEDRSNSILSGLKARGKDISGLTPSAATPAAKSGAGGWTVTVEK